MLPPSLVGEPHRGGFICPEWELRVTGRCLQEDLGARGDAPAFADVTGHEIVKAFVKERRQRTTDTRQVSGLTSGKEIWVLARGNDHRGATWFDELHHVVWLLAYRLHRSGDPADFFPYARELDAVATLLPDDDDYRHLLLDRDARFVFAVRIEAPLILRQARATSEEQRYELGGRHGTSLTIEVADDLEETTLAFKTARLPFEHLAVILTAFHADTDWAQVDRLPSRELEPDEIGFSHTHERPAMEVTEVGPADIRAVIAMRRALDAHNASGCGAPARAILVHDALGWDELWGLPVVADDSVRPDRIRIDCAGTPKEYDLDA